MGEAALRTLRFLSEIRDAEKDTVLSAVAKQYGISKEDAEKEITAPDAENLYEYMVEPMRSKVYHLMADLGI